MNSKESDDKINDELAELEAELDKEEELKKANEPKPKPRPKKDIKSEPDIYPDILEDKYHNMEKMVSLGVLEKEELLCFKIIKYKKKIDKDYVYWEIKKKNLKNKHKSITSLIEKGTWNLDLYKSKIKEEYNEDKNLLASAEAELNLTETQKDTLKERINERINILEGELKQANEHEAKNNEEIIQSLDDFKTKDADNVDLYPITTEDIYHNLGKFVCLGVLEKEKELCDKIIEYKKEKFKEFKKWETKKDNIDQKISSITSLVQNETWNLDIYKSKIKEESDWEKKLLDLAENDTSLNDTQKQIVKIRINNRIKLIEGELSRNPEEEDE